MSATHDTIRPSVVNLKRLRPGMKAAVTLGTQWNIGLSDEAYEVLGIEIR